MHHSASYHGVIKLLFLTLLAGVNTSPSQICPPPDVLHPCSCSEAGGKLAIECKDIKGDFNLKGIFDNASSFVNDEVVFDTLDISGTSLVEIEEGAIEQLKFLEIGIYLNENLTCISPGAVKASRNVTWKLDLLRNRISNRAPHERDIFEFVGSFPNLMELNLMDNDLISIPDNAFQNLPSLEWIYMAHNRITRIGSSAFLTGGSSLSYVNLQNNSLPSDGLPKDAFIGDWNKNVKFYLELNKMEFMERTSYKTLLDKAEYVGVGDFFENERIMYCDDRADWICEDEETYRNRLFGFQCKPGTGAEDIWEYCSGRNAIMH